MTERTMAIARWKGGKLHVTASGIKTGCGALIPAAAPSSNCRGRSSRRWTRYAKREWHAYIAGRRATPAD